MPLRALQSHCAQFLGGGGLEGRRWEVQGEMGREASKHKTSVVAVKAGSALDLER